MPRVEFYRIDLAVEVRRYEKGVRLHARVGTREWDAQVPTGALRPKREFPIREALLAWRNSILPGGASQRGLRRVTVEVYDASLAAIPWETVYPWDARVVRVTQVLPHRGIDPFKLPLRIVQVGTSPELSIPRTVYSLFGNRTRGSIRDAVLAERVKGAAELAANSKLGPTSDVLHLESWSEFVRPDIGSFADPAAIGTAAWLARICGNRQTRLLVLHCPEAERIHALPLAAALTAAGGPAVLVESLPTQVRVAFYKHFYSDLVHDFPLDAMLEQSLPVVPRTEQGLVSLFAGAGREDELRVSTIGVKALKLPRLTRKVSPFPGVPHQKEIKIQKVLDGLQQDWGTFKFEFHEHEGLLPLAAKVNEIRSILRSVPGRPVARKSPDAGLAGLGKRFSTGFGFEGGHFPAPPIRIKPSGRGEIVWKGEEAPPAKKPAPKKSPAKVETPAATAPRQRFLNIAFWRNDPPGQLKGVSQKGAVLQAGETYQLGINIAPKNLNIKVVESEAIEEERFRWTPEMKGVWVEIGVTGIDFEVVGNPVRELWLPREAATERIYFPVIPQGTAGVSRLRVCLFYNQDVIQSYRVAAVTTANGAGASAVARRKVLARALGLTPEDVKDAGFLSRLEYSTGSVHDVATHRDGPRRRMLSIVANDWDSDTVVTVKGPGLFSAQILTDSDVPQRVQDIRTRLQAASDYTFKDDSKGYAFGILGAPNGGTPEQLASALRSLVVPGWSLFDKLVLEDQREELDKFLSGENVTIHVAHILRDRVIPWNLLYDRAYDRNKGKDAAGNPVGRAVCTASLPKPDGTSPAGECYQNPDCLLSGYPGRRCTDARGNTLLPETVICPRHFWGFRHVIEVPPQQVPSGGKGTPMATEIPVTGKARLIVGVNCTLSLYDEHVKQIEALGGRFTASWVGPEYDRDKIIELLKDRDLSMIYFYCHAAGGAGSNLRDPELQFQGPEDKEAGVITPDELSYRLKWSRNPLVFLNGCGTVGYTPDALTPFMKKLVDDRGASGIVGTEVPVWEQLASEIAQRFFRMFLDGKPAGLALLFARRQLLAQNNPLGLIYTLYAAADLKLTSG